MKKYLILSIKLLLCMLVVVGMCIDIRMQHENTTRLDKIDKLIKQESKIVKSIQKYYSSNKWKQQVNCKGTFTVYWYTDNEACCGKTDGITASGTQATDGRTIAVDTSVIPMGSVVYIDQVGFRVAEDTGSGINGKSIDVFTDSYSEAVKNGKQHLQVYVFK